MQHVLRALSDGSRGSSLMIFCTCTCHDAHEGKHAGTRPAAQPAGESMLRMVRTPRAAGGREGGGLLGLRWGRPTERAALKAWFERPATWDVNNIVTHTHPHITLHIQQQPCTLAIAASASATLPPLRAADTGRSRTPPSLPPALLTRLLGVFPSDAEGGRCVASCIACIACNVSRDAYPCA